MMNVAFVPGEAFFPGGGHESTLRLNFSNMPVERIREGVRRLAGLAHVMLPRRLRPADPPGKYADCAIPALLAHIVAETTHVQEAASKAVAAVGELVAALAAEGPDWIIGSLVELSALPAMPRFANLQA